MRFAMIAILIIINIKCYANGIKKIIIGYFDAKPFSYYDDSKNEDIGIILDLLKIKIIKLKNIDIVYKQFPLSRLLDEIKTQN